MVLLVGFTILHETKLMETPSGLLELCIKSHIKLEVTGLKTYIKYYTLGIFMGG